MLDSTTISKRPPDDSLPLGDRLEGGGRLASLEKLPVAKILGDRIGQREKGAEDADNAHAGRLS